MSARTMRHHRYFVASAIGLCAVLSATAATAGDFRTVMHDVKSDLLLARPPVLATGALLPGDHVPHSCSTTVDLTVLVSLPDAVDIALCRNPQVQIAWAAIRAHAASVGQARAAYLPTLSGSVSGQRAVSRYSTQPTADTSAQNYSSYAAMNWRLFDFGERDANRRLANDLLAAALAAHDAALQKTLAQVVQAWFDALAAQAALKARYEAVQQAKQIYDAAQRRETRGATGRSDTLQSATAFARAQLAERRAAGDADKAMASLVFALGVPAGTRLVLPQDTPRPAKQRVADLAQWLDMANARHPGILAARKRWEAARQKVTTVRSQGLPTVDFGASFYQNGYPNQAVQATRSKTAIIGFTLTIPLFEGFSGTYRIRETEALAEQEKAQVEDTERQILGEIVGAYFDAVSALASLDASDMLLELAKASLESSKNRYKYGVADILEVLNAQAALADAWQEHIRTESSWRAARLRLMASAGLLGREAISDIDAGRRGSLTPD